MARYSLAGHSLAGNIFGGKYYWQDIFLAGHSLTGRFFWQEIFMAGNIFVREIDLPKFVYYTFKTWYHLWRSRVC